MIRHRLLAAMGSVRLQTKAWVNASSCVSGKFTRSLGGNCGMSAWNCRRWRTLSLGSQLSRAYATKKSCSGVPPCSPATRKSECCVLWMFSRSCLFATLGPDALFLDVDLDLEPELLPRVLLSGVVDRSRGRPRCSSRSFLEARSSARGFSNSLFRSR